QGNDQVSRHEEQSFCDLCGLEGGIYSSFASYDILKCSKCSLIWTNPLLHEPVIFPFEEVYLANETPQKDRFRAQLRTFLRKTKQQDARGLRILEVGSGLGFFLDVCEEFKMSAEGCDITEQCIRHANRNRERVRRGTLDEYYAGGNFDAVFAFN